MDKVGFIPDINVNKFITRGEIVEEFYANGIFGLEPEFFVRQSQRMNPWTERSIAK